MKNLRKLVIASFMLVIAFVAVVSSTYAWFTRGQEATVNNIEIGVTDASKSLLIGKENGVWSRSVTVKPYGKLTPVTLRSANVNAQNRTGLFQQLEWDEDLVPSFKNSRALNEEYVKTSDTAIDESKTYYTLTVADNHNVTFTAVQSPVVADIATYYEKAAETVKYVNTSDTAIDESKTYYTSEGVAIAASDLDEEDIASYYELNPNYVAEGYIAFDLFFQISVDKAADWATTKIQMSLNNLRAVDVEDEQVTSNSNERALSSFRLAVAEGATGSQTFARIVEGKGYYTVVNTEGPSTSQEEYNGVYGVGDQFVPTNGWLEMLKNSAANTTVINKNDSAFYLEDDYKDELSTNRYNETTNPTGKAIKLDELEYEYVMDCGSNAALLNTSGDGLTKTFQITVYVWMEGWDGDCINAAASCQYYFGLSFRAI